MDEIEVASNLEVAGRPVGVFNTVSDTLSTEQVLGDKQTREIAAQLSRWIDNARNAGGKSSMFDRGAFTPPDNPYDEMRSAKMAVRYDSVVSGVAEITEAFAFQGVKWEGEDADEADVFNQLARDQNLDDVVRKMWREEYTNGQFICAKLWGWQEYTVRGKTANGNKKKKKYRIWAPLQLRILDSCKVVPVGVGPLGGDNLAWQATSHEIGYYDDCFRGQIIDPLMVAFFAGQYTPGYDEVAELSQLGVNTSKLLLMDPQWVFRHTITRPDYERFADIRLKSVFSLLDLKRQLMQSDRATLIGAANYILLIRKGESENPATSDEISNLKQQYNFIAKLPVIISDHRLQIDIIAPKQDFVLETAKYENLNSQILARLLGTLTVTASSSRSGNSDTMAMSVAKVMENRRHMLKRTLEREIARAVVRHPKNAGVFETEPNMVYTPRNINLDLNNGYATALLALRTQREVSRETTLEFFGLDQATEAQRMAMEDELFDDIFQTQIPFAAAPGDPSAGDAAGDKTKDGANGDPASAPASKQPSTGTKKATPNGTAESPAVSGARGGRPRGGGQSTKSPAKQAAPKSAGGNQKTGS